ncbi:hypothetical protein COOONC_18994 [Cooperia oncophora]
MEHVLPLYGNTHSSVTVTSEQTTLFVHEARQEIRAMTGAGDGDSVMFVGSGSTAAVELLVHLMQPENLVLFSFVSGGDFICSRAPLKHATVAYSCGSLLLCTGVQRRWHRSRYNALSVWDYASSAPYVEINVNGSHPVDAVFFSGHKFVGGVSTPGKFFR